MWMCSFIYLLNKWARPSPGEMAGTMKDLILDLQELLAGKTGSKDINEGKIIPERDSFHEKRTCRCVGACTVSPETCVAFLRSWHLSWVLNDQEPAA